MEVPPPILAVFLLCRLPWFFCFFFLSDRFVPFVFIALGHCTGPLGPPKYKKTRKGKTAVRGCPSDMAVRMREVMARPWIGVCVPLASILVINLRMSW